MNETGFFSQKFSFTPQKKEVKEIEIVKVAIDQETGHQFAVAKVHDEEVILHEFNIRDKRSRKVVCIYGACGCRRGVVYNVTHVDVHSNVTYLTLKENTFTHHNSVHFAELP